MQDFRKLDVWARSHQFVLRVYDVTSMFPDDERFGLTSQIRRSAASVPANIAEACGRDGGRDMARFLQIAMGSACEVEYHLILAADLRLTSEEDEAELMNEIVRVKRILAALIARVRHVDPATPA